MAALSYLKNGSNNSRKGHRYKELASTTRNADLLIAGTAGDRLHGLEDLLRSSAGKTVLDVGCHDGTVAEAFANAGAAQIDGCDIFRAGVEQAKRRVSPIQPNNAFFVADLSAGAAALHELRLDRYDIVCYLGVHQHLAKQMDRSALRELELHIFGKATRELVVRTPAASFPRLETTVAEAGFTPAGDLITGNVGPLRIFVRDHAFCS
ncbi:MAG: class I SAM-dependent methyltransferase [Gammaproteobacteria bacterium]